MLLKGDVAIHALRKWAWNFLIDPNQIGKCVSGVENIEVIERKSKYKGVICEERVFPDACRREATSFIERGIASGSAPSQ